MLFSSMIFLWIFLPCVLFGNFILTILPFSDERKRLRAKNILLLVSSLLFYAWGGIYYLLIMASCIVINYLGGQLITYRYKEKKERRRCLAAVIALNLTILFVFKYFNMAVIIVENILDPGAGSLINMTGTGALGIKEIVLPIGISFFTFQAMSYVIDVYRGDAPVQDNFLDFALYVAFFPQLIAGPIVRYKDIAAQISSRPERVKQKAEGIRRFCYGLGKKVLLANTFAAAADSIWGLNRPAAGAAAWLGAVCYTLQIYYDFSGYSDMAIGLGKMFGFDFKENFNYPYISQSVTEFWRRWHISLGTFFRDYVYIPLGGNRVGVWKHIRNILVVWFLTGFWHGASWNFIAWGVYYGLLLLAEKFLLQKIKQKLPAAVNVLTTLLLVLVGWVLFYYVDLGQGLHHLKVMFGFGGAELTDPAVIYYFKHNLVFLVAAALASVPWKLWQEKLPKGTRRQLRDTARWLKPAAVTVLFFLSVAMVVGQSYNPFLYFRF